MRTRRCLLTGAPSHEGNESGGHRALAPALTVSELARVAVGAEPDRIVVYVEVELPPFRVGGKPHVSALGAGGC